MTNTKPTHPSGLPPDYATARDRAENDERSIDQILLDIKNSVWVQGDIQLLATRVEDLTKKVERIETFSKFESSVLDECGVLLGVEAGELVSSMPGHVRKVVAEVRSLESDLTELRAVRDRAANGEGMTTLEMKMTDGTMFVGYGIASRPDSLAYGKSEASDA